VTELDPSILEMARDETEQCLDRIERNLLAFESRAPDGDALDATFRDAHSIRGTASMVGWQEVSSIAHAIEEPLADCRDSGSFPPERAEPLLRTAQALRRAISREDGNGYSSRGIPSR
jgi:chemotaxis protein histidine kinase CheA